MNRAFFKMCFVQISTSTISNISLMYLVLSVSFHSISFWISGLSKMFDSILFSDKDVFTSICIGDGDSLSNFNILYIGNDCGNHCEYSCVNIQ